MKEYEKLTPDGKHIYYEITDDGFNIYIGQTKRPTFKQYEPYIPDPSISYEENAINMCKELTTEHTHDENPIEDRLTNIEANIDYLMLLNDPDSAAETEE